MTSRRSLLKALAAFGAIGTTASLATPSTATTSNAYASSECFLIGDGRRGGESLLGGTRDSSHPGRVRIWRPGQTHTVAIELPFLPHSFIAHPDHPQRVVTFEKWGRHLAELDLDAMTTIRITRTPAGKRYFGHGAHLGQFFCATQMDDANGQGQVAVMDATTHQVVREIATRGAFPHDCRWLPSSRELVVVNSRQTPMNTAGATNPSSAVWLDVERGECRRQTFIDTPEFGYAHVACAADGFMVVSGSYTAAGRSQPLLAAIRPDTTVAPLIARTTTLVGEALSLYLDEQRQWVTTTLPSASRVQVWNYRTGTLIRQLSLEEPRALAYSPTLRELLVSSAKSGSFLSFDSSRTRLELRTVAAGLGGNGSHLFPLQSQRIAQFSTL